MSDHARRGHGGSGHGEPGTAAHGNAAAVHSVVRVVAAALWNCAGELLIAQRPAGKPLAGRWEFPGGKVDGEETELEALRRELREELGVHLESARPLMRASARYGERDIEIALWMVEAFSGTPRALDGQRLKWVAPAGLPAEDILEADRPFIEVLQTLSPPPQYNADVNPRRHLHGSTE